MSVIQSTLVAKHMSGKIKGVRDYASNVSHNLCVDYKSKIMRRLIALKRLCVKYQSYNVCQTLCEDCNV